ncbi:MAG: hypothetical protein FJ390_02370 [Verrucomicrobia bacterium]|nr:hypothetical protein [Verrucomicrobiota bacterium]
MINKAFVINLDSKPEQFQEVQKAFQPYGIECERYVVMSNEHKQIGCTMTHLEIIARAKKERWPYVFVIEDDCVPREAIKEWPAISQFLLQEKNRWDLFLGGALFVYPKKLATDFKSKESLQLELIECIDAITAHFIIYNQSSYDRLLDWYDLPLPLEKRPNIDNLFGKDQFKIWVPSPFIAWQKPHSGWSWEKEFERAEEKLRYFSQEIKKSRKYRWFGKWLKTVS